MDEGSESALNAASVSEATGDAASKSSFSARSRRAAMIAGDTEGASSAVTRLLSRPGSGGRASVVSIRLCWTSDSLGGLLSKYGCARTTNCSTTTEESLVTSKALPVIARRVYEQPRPLLVKRSHNPLKLLRQRKEEAVVPKRMLSPDGAHRNV